MAKVPEVPEVLKQIYKYKYTHKDNPENNTKDVLYYNTNTKTYTEGKLLCSSNYGFNLDSNPSKTDDGTPRIFGVNIIMTTVINNFSPSDVITNYFPVFPTGMWTYINNKKIQVFKSDSSKKKFKYNLLVEKIIKNIPEQDWIPVDAELSYNNLHKCDVLSPPENEHPKVFSIEDLNDEEIVIQDNEKPNVRYLVINASNNNVICNKILYYLNLDYLYQKTEYIKKEEKEEEEYNVPHREYIYYIINHDEDPDKIFIDYSKTYYFQFDENKNKVYMKDKNDNTKNTLIFENFNEIPKIDYKLYDSSIQYDNYSVFFSISNSNILNPKNITRYIIYSVDEEHFESNVHFDRYEMFGYKFNNDIKFLLTHIYHRMLYLQAYYIYIFQYMKIDIYLSYEFNTKNEKLNNFYGNFIDTDGELDTYKCIKSYIEYCYKYIKYGNGDYEEDDEQYDFTLEYKNNFETSTEPNIFIYICPITLDKWNQLKENNETSCINKFYIIFDVLDHFIENKKKINFEYYDITNNKKDIPDYDYTLTIQPFIPSIIYDDISEEIKKNNEPYIEIMKLTVLHNLLNILYNNIKFNIHMNIPESVLSFYDNYYQQLSSSLLHGGKSNNYYDMYMINKSKYLNIENNTFYQKYITNKNKYEKLKML